MLLLLLSCLLVGMVHGQPAQQFCVLNCEAVDNSTLVYCSDPEAGIVNYTSCLAPQDRNSAAADTRALNQSMTMPRFSDDISCLNAQKRLLCALLFPKCDPDQQKIVQQPVCQSICINFFKSCNVQLSTQCDNTVGTAPSPTCTGNFGSLLTPGMMMLVVSILLGLLAL